MTTQLPQNNLSTVVSASRASNMISHVEADHAATIQRGSRLDTIEAAQKQKKSPSSVPPNRVVLPPPAPSKNPNYMMLIAEAFGKAFLAMDFGVICQTKDYASLQQLDQTMATCVLNSTVNAITSEEKEVNVAKQINDYQAAVAKRNGTIGTVFLVVGIVLMAVTVLSSVLTFGAADAALPEEAEMIEMSTVSDNGVGQVTTDSTNLAGSLTSQASNVASTSESISQTEDQASTIESLDSDLQDTASTTENEEVQTNTSRAVESDSSRSSQANQRSINQQSKVQKALTSGKAAARWGGKKLFQMGVGAALGSSSLIKGLSQLTIHDKLNQLSGIQENLGKALATMQENSKYFQFYQELVQRAGNVIQEESSDASEVIDTYADVLSAYRQIPYGLASIS